MRASPGASTAGAGCWGQEAGSGRGARGGSIRARRLAGEGLVGMGLVTVCPSRGRVWRDGGGALCASLPCSSVRIGRGAHAGVGSSASRLEGELDCSRRPRWRGSRGAFRARPYLRVRESASKPLLAQTCLGLIGGAYPQFSAPISRRDTRGRKRHSGVSRLETDSGRGSDWGRIDDRMPRSAICGPRRGSAGRGANGLESLQGFTGP